MTLLRRKLHQSLVFNIYSKHITSSNKHETSKLYVEGTLVYNYVPILTPRKGQTGLRESVWYRRGKHRRMPSVHFNTSYTYVTLFACFSYTKVGLSMEHWVTPPFVVCPSAIVSVCPICMADDITRLALHSIFFCICCVIKLSISLSGAKFLKRLYLGSTPKLILLWKLYHIN